MRTGRAWRWGAMAVGAAAAAAIATPATAMAAAGNWQTQSEKWLEQSARWTHVEALAPDNVWAGGTQNIISDAYQPAVAHYDGKNWSELDLPADVAKEYVSLNGFDAVSSDNVWLSLSDSTTGKRFFYQYDGDSWRKVTAKGTGSWAGELTASSSRAWTQTGKGSVARYLDGSWKKMAVTDSGELGSIDAWARDDVWAVGAYGDQPMAKHWDGSKWRKTTLPTKDCKLTDVTTVARDRAYTFCATDTSFTALTWDGKEWSKAGPAVSLDKGNLPVSITANAAGEVWVGGGPGGVWHLGEGADTWAQEDVPGASEGDYHEPSVNDIDAAPGTNTVVGVGEAEEIVEDPEGDPLPSIDLIWRNG